MQAPTLGTKISAVPPTAPPYPVQTAVTQRKRPAEDFATKRRTHLFPNSPAEVRLIAAGPSKRMRVDGGAEDGKAEHKQKKKMKPGFICEFSSLALICALT